MFGHCGSEIPEQARVHFKVEVAHQEATFGTHNVHVLKMHDIALTHDKLATAPIGTGPFKFKSYTPGDRVELVKFDNYFETGMPKLDAVTLLVMPESASKVTALETGEIHVVWKLPIESVDRLKQNPDIVVDEVSTSSWDGIIMNNSKKPFDSLPLRQS